MILRKVSNSFFKRAISFAFVAFTAGIHPKALGKIIEFGVDRIVYISCKPTSLVRDLVVLQEKGYRVEKGCAVDMFPGTGNVETVCLLKKI